MADLGQYVKVDDVGLITLSGGRFWKPKTYKWCEIDTIYAVQVPFALMKVEMYRKDGKCIYAFEDWEGWDEFIEKIYEVFSGFSKENFEKAKHLDEQVFLCWERKKD